MIIDRDYARKIIDLNIEPIEYIKKIGKSKTCINYINSGFDIETTTTYKKDNKGKVIEHFTNMYVWQWSLNEHVIVGRTFEELNDCINAFRHIFCKDGKQIIVFIHNLSFEFAQLSRTLQLEYHHDIEVFARSKRKPMKWILDNQIIFLDSYLITGYSLQNLAKNFCKTQKLVGDLDYNLIRNSKTELSLQEWKYCYNDVVILSEFAEYYRKEYMEVSQLIMTKTMIANLCVKDKIKETEENPFFLMQKTFPKSQEEYNFALQFFTGAYTHAYVFRLFEKIENCVGFDVNSEYPFCMMAKYMPMGKWRKVINIDLIENLMERYCVLAIVELTNIKTKTGVTILSKNKLYNIDGAVWDNGRLYKAKSCCACLCEVDIKTLRMHYDFDIEYKEAIYCKRGKLPKYMRLAIAELYDTKNQLKGNEEMQTEYAVTKSKLNSLYGACVCKLQPVEISVNIEGNWQEETKDIDFDTIWKSKNKTVYWGIYITAHARNLVLSAVKKIFDEEEKRGISHNDSAYIYTDTDSIKAINRDYVWEVFNKINEQIRKENQEFIAELELKELYPHSDFSILGEFSFENNMDFFKTLGSKRYIYQDEKGLHQTIAGLPKGTFENYCNENNLDYFDEFTDEGIYIADSQTEKLTTYYNDEYKEWEVTDYQGNIENYHTFSYVSLIPTTFNLKVTDDLIRLANMLKSIKGE